MSTIFKQQNGMNIVGQGAKTILIMLQSVVAAIMVRNLLLICGIVSSLLHVATDVLASWLYAGSSYTDQNYSELLAIALLRAPKEQY